VSPSATAIPTPRTLATRYWVSPTEDGWSVAREEQVLARYPDRARAIVAAVALARVDRPAELLIRDIDGIIAEHRPFAREPSVTLDAAPPISMPDDERFAICDRTPHQVTMEVRGDLAHEAWLVQLTRVILDELEDTDLFTLVVDMSGVTDFDVACIAGWVGLEHYVRDQGRSLRIRNASAAVLTVLESMTIAL
jgi:hypothetical protein